MQFGMDRAVTGTFKKSRLLPLDLLRGGAASVVAIGHAGVLSNIDFGLCVVFFYVLSGYVLAYAYGDAIGSRRMSAYDFVVIRIARLYPLHILTAAFVAGLWTAWFLLLHHDLPNVSKPTTSGVLETITLTQSLLTGGWSLNTPSWSIAAELWCGLIILPLCSSSRILRSVAVVVCVLAYIVTAMNGGFLTSRTLKYGTALGCFAVGWGLHFFRVDRSAWIGWPIAICAFLSLMFSPVSSQGRPLLELGYVFAFALVVLLLAGAKMPGWTSGLATLSGDLSYGIYLWHWPLLDLVGTLPLPKAVKAMIFAPLLLSVCLLSFRYFEVPSRRYIRALMLRRALWSSGKVAASLAVGTAKEDLAAGPAA
jgi:peptidoglycan/LPS O-acetylase OafA/YrhL